MQNTTPVPTPAAAAPAALDSAFAADAAFQPLAPQARTAMRLGALVGALVLGLAPAIPLYLVLVFRGELGVAAYAAILGTWLAVLCGMAWWLAGVRWQRTRWRLDDDGLTVRRGVLVRVETLVPHSRVQHVDIAHGPIDRRFGLATLKIHTAGTRLASVALGGLQQARAEALRDALILRADHAGDADAPASPASMHASGTASGAGDDGGD